MARLALESGTTLTDLAKIQAEMAPMGISLASWPTGDNPELVALLAKPGLADVEKEQTLGHLDGYFQQLKDNAGYQSRDLVVLHPELPNLAQALSRFSPCHTHDDDEVRYIVDGEGIFGFVRPDGSQVALTVEAGEYINVPKNTEHWFVLTEKNRIKAVRYFTTMDGWTPVYTGTGKRV